MYARELLLRRFAAGTREPAYAVFFVPVRKIFRASHTGATNTCTGWVRKAGLLPSIKGPSQARANAVGIRSSAITQCHQTTISEEKPHGNGNHMQGAVDWMVVSAVIVRVEARISPHAKKAPDSGIISPSGGGETLKPLETLSSGQVCTLFPKPFQGYTSVALECWVLDFASTTLGAGRFVVEIEAHSLRRPSPPGYFHGRARRQGQQFR